VEHLTLADVWKKAAFLDERVHKQAWTDLPEHRSLREAAERRARAWQESMMSDEAAFEDRLRLVGLDREAFLLSLSDVGVEVGAWADGGAWLATLREVIEQRHGSEPIPSILSAQTVPEAPTQPFFPGFLRPFLQVGAARLRAGTAAIGARHGLKDTLLSESAEATLIENLAWSLQGKALRLLVLELHIAKLRDKLPQGTPQERFAYFATDYFQDAEALLDLLRKAPVLARLLATTVDRWVDVSLELLERIVADRALIRDTFFSGADIGAVAGLETGIGDMHRRGRSVVQLEFTSGLKLVYKPRSLAVEVKFQDLLGWLNAKGLTTPHRLFTVVDRGSYGWVEFVKAAECESSEGVERFYIRQGSYLAVLHVLKAIDLHQENLIAAGEHPVIVDLEALFHHKTPAPVGETAYSRALELLGESILAIGLLPVLLPQVGQRVDFSGLGGEGGQLLSQQVPVLEETHRDTMRVVRGQAVTQASNNRPRLHGELVDPASFVKKMVEGFRETYRLILQHRDELACILCTFADVEIRHLLRPSMRYAFLLSEGTHPDFLRDALEQDRMADKLWAEAAQQPALRRVVAFESADLRRGDIPIFTARPGERDLWSSTGERIQEFFERDSLSEALERLARMSDDDCAEQTSLLCKSLIALERSHHVMQNTQRLSGAAGAVEREAPGDFLATAVVIGETLKAAAIQGRDDVTWLGESAANLERWRWALSPLPLGVYEGLGGMALFFAHLAAATDRGDFEALARAALQPILREVQSKERPGISGVGAFSGEASNVYVLSCLAALWREPALLDSALAALPAIEAQSGADEALDILSGVAGCVVTLLGLYRRTEDKRVLEAAKRCGDRLLAKAVPTRSGGIGWKSPMMERPLAGFTHGVAGIAWALLELGAATGDERYRDAARKGLDYERSLFLPARGTWQDVRFSEAPPTSAESVMVAWCHGAPGVALGRMLSLQHLDEPQVRSEIHVGLETTLREGFGFDHCLCHGDMGNIDILLVASEVLKDPRFRQAASQRAAATLAQARQHGFRCGLALEHESPSLMLGLAGIGFGLLRLWSPERVPSVLCLDATVHPALSRCFAVCR
jgi:type 2 lantibiotic biosynthesis protein LanM